MSGKPKYESYHPTQEVNVHPTTGVRIAYMEKKVNAHTCMPTKVTVIAGCKFNHDITTTSMML